MLAAAAVDDLVALVAIPGDGVLERRVEVAPRRVLGGLARHVKCVRRLDVKQGRDRVERVLVVNNTVPLPEGHPEVRQPRAVESVDSSEVARHVEVASAYVKRQTSRYAHADAPWSGGGFSVLGRWCIGASRRGQRGVQWARLTKSFIIIVGVAR